MFSDDSALTGFKLNGNDQYHREQVERFVTWCEDSYLNLNLSKTKEVITDFRMRKRVATPAIISRLRGFSHINIWVFILTRT